MITVQIETYSECVDDLKRLHHEHHNETNGANFFALNPDYATYTRLAESGVLNMVSVRNGLVLVGYLLFIIITDLHHQIKTAIEDIYFLQKQYRGAWVGVKMFRAFISKAKQLGAKIIRVSAPIAADNAAIFKRLGLLPSEINYSMGV